MDKDKIEKKTVDGENTPSFLLPSISAYASQDKSKNFVQLVGGNFFKKGINL
jgi:hypothetical protein